MVSAHLSCFSYEYHVVPVELLSCKIVAKVTHPQKDIISVVNSRYCFHTLLAIFVKHTTMYNSNKYVALLTLKWGCCHLKKNSSKHYTNLMEVM